MAVHKLNLNGTVPTVEQVKELFKNECSSMEMNSDWRSYEGNMEFEELELEFANGEVLYIAGYNGIFEILAWRRLSIHGRVQTQREVLDWLTSCMVDGEQELLEIED